MSSRRVDGQIGKRVHKLLILSECLSFVQNEGHL